MAYTAVKLADVNKAIAAAKAAQAKYDTAVSSSSTSKADLDKAQKARDEAFKKVSSLKDSLESSIRGDSRYQTASSKVQSAKEALDKAKQFVDSKDYLKGNDAYKKAVDSFNDADQKLKDAYRLKDSGDYLKNNSDYQKALETFKTREEEFRKADDYRKNSNDRYNSDSDIKNYRSKYEEAQKAVDRAWENVLNASKANEASAEQKWNEARKNADTIGSKLQQAIESNDSKADTAVNNAIKARDAADQSKNKAEEDASKYINTFISNAKNTRDTADATKNKLEETLTKNAQTAQSTAQSSFDTANSTLDKVYGVINKEKQTAIDTAQKDFDTADKAFGTVQDTYQRLQDSFEGLLRDRNNAIGSVTDYIGQIKGSLSDVKSAADAKQVQTLLGQIQTAVKGTKLDDLIKPVTSMISQIDPLKMATIPKVNIQGANPDVFSNIDPNTGLPILNQGGLDAVLDRYKSNKIDDQQYRDNWNKFGWNVKSDASTAMRGPAVVGLDMGTVQQGMAPGATGIVKAGTNQAASDADFKKAADQLGIDINDYYTTKETTGAYGTKSTAQVLDRQSLYDDIADRTKDFYMVANSIDGNKHAALLFRADGSGNLVPVTNDQGAPMANYYTATRNVTGETWYGDLLPIAAIAASFALPGIGTAFAQSAAGSALAASIGTTAATAVTNAALSAGLAAITGGDVGKAALTAGLGTFAAQNATQIANKVVGEQNIKAIADAANLTRGQVENIIASGLNEGLSSAIAGQGDILQNMAKSVASGFTSESARNIATRAVLDADQDTISRVADSVANLTNVGTQAALNGLNPIDAIAASAPYIISSTSGVQVEERAPIVDKSVVYGQQEAYQQVLEAFGASPEEAKAEALRMAQQGFRPEQVGEKIAALATIPGGETIPLYGTQEKGMMLPPPTTLRESGAPSIEKTKEEILENILYQSPTSSVPSGSQTTRPVNVEYPSFFGNDYQFNQIFSQYQSQASNLFKSIGFEPNNSQINSLASELMASALSKSGAQNFNMQMGQSAGDSSGQPEGILSGVSNGALDGIPGGVPGGIPGGVPGGLPGGAGAGGTGTGGTGEEGTGTEAQKQAALQQYLQQVKAQQQRTQELINPKSVYYLTPEEQLERRYIDPSELDQSISPFRRGGLASMKRNAKWQ